MPLSSRSDPGQGAGPPRYPGTFLLALREAAASLGWQVGRCAGHLVQCIDAEGRPQIVGLENVYRRLRRTPRAEWPGLLAEHLRTLVRVQQEQQVPDNLADAAGRLLPRLGPSMKQAAAGAPVWSQPLVEGELYLHLVLDGEQGMAYVSEKLVADSGRPAAEWLRRALDNLRERTPADCFGSVDPDLEVRACTLGDAYDSSRALLLDALLPEQRELGWFVALPGRDHCAVLPVGIGGLAQVHLLKALAEHHCRGTPYAISEQVFWYRGGEWRVFPIRIQGDKVSVEPPEEFAAVLRQLLPAEENPPE